MKSSGDVPLVFPVPTPVALPNESKLVLVTRFLSWLTACLLAVSVIISLVAVTSERNDLRNQLQAQSTELACRSAAAIEVNKAVAKRDNKLTIALTHLGDQATLDLDVIELLALTDDVNNAIEDQEVALKECDKS